MAPAYTPVNCKTYPCHRVSVGWYEGLPRTCVGERDSLRGLRLRVLVPQGKNCKFTGLHCIFLPGSREKIQNNPCKTYNSFPGGRVLGREGDCLRVGHGRVFHCPTCKRLACLPPPQEQQVRRFLMLVYGMVQRQGEKYVYVTPQALPPSTSALFSVESQYSMFSLPPNAVQT